MVGHYRHDSKAGGPMMAHFKWPLDPLSIPSIKKKENIVSVGPPLTKLSGSADVLDGRNDHNRHQGLLLCLDGRQHRLLLR